MLPPRIHPLLLVTALFLPALSAPGQGQGNLTGVWAFDPARKKVYLDSFNSGRPGAPMAEIAPAMGLARVEGSQYELGGDSKGPYLSITDKTSKLPTIVHVKVSKTASELVLTAIDTGHRYRLRPLDPSHVDLIDEQKGVTIPLTRR